MASQREFNWPVNQTTVSSGPIQYSKNGSNTTVSIDTTTPSSSNPLPVEDAGKSYLGSVRLDYSSTTVTNAAWTQLLASVGASGVFGLTLFDSGGYAMELGIGGAGSEVRTLLIPPGGFNGVIPLNITGGTRLSIRAVGAASVSAGEININLLG